MIHQKIFSIKKAIKEKRGTKKMRLRKMAEINPTI